MHTYFTSYWNELIVSFMNTWSSTAWIRHGGGLGTDAGIGSGVRPIRTSGASQSWSCSGNSSIWRLWVAHNIIFDWRHSGTGGRQDHKPSVYSLEQYFHLQWNCWVRWHLQFIVESSQNRFWFIYDQNWCNVMNLRWELNYITYFKSLVYFFFTSKKSIRKKW